MRKPLFQHKNIIRAVATLALSIGAIGGAGGLGGCTDYLTGQLPEPDGPVLVLRLTLFDTARKAPVFTDTSIPDCSLAANADTLNCSADPNTDKFSPKNSPPTTDSGNEIRAVFNN